MSLRITEIMIYAVGLAAVVLVAIALGQALLRFARRRLGRPARCFDRIERGRNMEMEFPCAAQWASREGIPERFRARQPAAFAEHRIRKHCHQNRQPPTCRLGCPRSAPAATPDVGARVARRWRPEPERHERSSQVVR